MYEVKLDINTQNITFQLLLGKDTFTAFWQLQDDGIFMHVPNDNNDLPLMRVQSISVGLNNSLDDAVTGIGIVSGCIMRHYAVTPKGKPNKKPSVVRITVNCYGWTTYLQIGRYTLIERWEIKKTAIQCVVPFRENLVVFPMYAALDQLTPYLIEIVFQMQQTAYELVDRIHKK